VASQPTSDSVPEDHQKFPNGRAYFRTGQFHFLALPWGAAASTFAGKFRRISQEGWIDEGLHYRHSWRSRRSRGPPTVQVRPPRERMGPQVSEESVGRGHSRRCNETRGMPSAGSRRLAQRLSRWPTLASLNSNWSKTPTGSASGRKKLRLMTAYRILVRTTEAGSPAGSAHWPFLA
jgi:hypothetical protein